MEHDYSSFDEELAATVNSSEADSMSKAAACTKTATQKAAEEADSMRKSGASAKTSAITGKVAAAKPLPHVVPARVLPLGPYISLPPPGGSQPPLTKYLMQAISPATSVHAVGTKALTAPPKVANGSSHQAAHCSSMRALGALAKSSLTRHHETAGARAKSSSVQPANGTFGMETSTIDKEQSLKRIRVSCGGIELDQASACNTGLDPGRSTNKGTSKVSEEALQEQWVNVFARMQDEGMGVRAGDYAEALKSIRHRAAALQRHQTIIEASCGELLQTAYREALHVRLERLIDEAILDAPEGVIQSARLAAGVDALAPTENMQMEMLTSCSV